MPASSQASSELSTASLTVVKRALRELSNPSKCLFLAKNSLTETSRCLVAIDSAVARRDLVGGLVIPLDLSSQFRRQIKCCTSRDRK